MIYRITICFLALCFGLNAQEIEEEPKDYSEHVLTIDSTMETLYSVISGEKAEQRDWELFKYLFDENSRLIPSGKNPDNITVVRFMTPQDYIDTSGKWLVENGFYEVEIHREVDTFGHIAQVFSTYESYRSKSDDEPFMRGINSIQMFYDGERWVILNIFWMQENEENPIPQDYLPNN